MHHPPQLPETLHERAVVWHACVTSPDGLNVLAAGRADGTAVYAVIRRGRLLIAPSPIALDIRGTRFVPEPLAVVSGTRDLSGDVPFHTRRPHLALTAAVARIDYGPLSLTLAATDLGVAFRWESRLEAEAEITDETFTLVPEGAPELLFAYNPSAYGEDRLQHPFESPHNRAPIDAVLPGRAVYLPITALYGHAVLCLSEAELRDYPGLNLERRPEEPGRLRGIFAAWPTAEDGSSRRYSRVLNRAAYLVRSEGTRSYPWRLFMLADTPAGIYGNDLTLALSEPSEGDFSWVRPGKVAWDWWNAWGLTHVPFTPGVNTETYRAYIDFAARFGLGYVILDEGWAVNLDVTSVVPELDLPDVLAHAKRRGVRIVLWSSWQQLIGRQERIFAHYAAMGVSGFKIDFFDRDDAAVARFLYETAEAAARHRLILAYHGIHKPTGLQRTWPNVLTYEGIFGLEQVKWTSSTTDFIVNDIRLAFARIPAGPADYTPGAMRNAPREMMRPVYAHPMSMGTRCRQAALFLLYDTGFQMLCDSPSAYLHEPDYTGLLADVPLLWDSTVCDAASDPDTLLLVRRTKDDAVWYGAIVGHEELTLEIPMTALGPGRFVATILQDGPTAAIVGTDYILKRRHVTADDVLRIPCAPGGGCLLRIRPEEAEEPQPGRPYPSGLSKCESTAQ